MAETKARYLAVVEIATSEIVASSDLSGRTEGEITKIITGRLRQMRDGFFVFDGEGAPPAVGSKWVSR